ncbi:LVIVD repeat-containing protein [Nocardiopsis sp. NPDC050513]|uniref:LVIVD repeat-containing protein n=1 Tax=Nocardiopsis sp. NPDC050513 TaxID=3364338 RepID=UPI00379A7B70
MRARTPARRGLRRSAVLALTAAASLVAGLLAPATALADTPPSDSITSDNVTHVTNVPKPEAVRSVNSDLAFTGDYAIGGNYDGFVVYDISEPESPQVVSEVLCPGGQGDVSVSGDLLYFSVDYPRASDECGAPATPTTDPDGFEGIRVFDISDKANPQYVAAVRTDCGSHTNTLVPSEDGESDIVYVSSYSPSSAFPNCQTPHDKITVIEVPHDAPEEAAIVNEPVLFPDGGNHDQDGLLLPTQGCHDITVYPARDLAAGACMGDGILMDISDPVNPVVTERVTDENFAFWHSATFTNSGDTVMFTDELGGGGAPTCTPEIGGERGADAIYTIERDGDGPALEFASYFKIERHQGDEQTCVAHNGSLIPVPGRDYFVQSWYQGGVSVIDFNDPRDPREIGYFDMDSRVEEGVQDNDTWSTYYYNGYVYSSDIVRGIDVLRLEDPRLRAAERVEMEEFNPQSQPVYRPGRGNGGR